MKFLYELGQELAELSWMSPIRRVRPDNTHYLGDNNNLANMLGDSFLFKIVLINPISLSTYKSSDESKIRQNGQNEVFIKASLNHVPELVDTRLDEFD